MLGHFFDFLNLLREDLQTFFDGLLESEGDLADGTQRPADEVGVSLGDVLLELVEDWLVVLVVNDADEDLSASANRLTSFRF